MADTSFITAEDLITFYDYNVIGQLLNDSGTPVLPADLDTNVNLQSLMNAASGTVLAYTLKGGMYQESQLYALTGISQAWLKNITANICVWMLILRRGLPVADYPQTLLALAELEALASGALIFNVPAVIAAGSAEDPIWTAKMIEEQHFTRDRIGFIPRRSFTKSQY